MSHRDDERSTTTRRRRPQPRGARVPSWLFYTVTLVIVGLWGTGIVISFVSTTFQMPETLNAVIPNVLLVVYGTKALSDNRKDDDDQ